MVWKTRVRAEREPGDRAAAWVARVHQRASGAVFTFLLRFIAGVGRRWALWILDSTVRSAFLLHHEAHTPAGRVIYFVWLCCSAAMWLLLAGARRDKSTRSPCSVVSSLIFVSTPLFPSSHVLFPTSHVSRCVQPVHAYP